jgi:hypothetical protein
MKLVAGQLVVAELGGGLKVCTVVERVQAGYRVSYKKGKPRFVTSDQVHSLDTLLAAAHAARAERVTIGMAVFVATISSGVEFGVVTDVCPSDGWFCYRIVDPNDPHPGRFRAATYHNIVEVLPEVVRVSAGGSGVIADEDIKRLYDTYSEQPVNVR